ncbi:MAG: CoxL CutL, partial [Acidobacteria bacterium]|nr:CoxL CutL [Acidobacteriota bacterium]
MSARFDVVGTSERKVDGLALVTGRPVFAGDLDLPDTLHLALLASPHAHARIRHIDAGAAARLPGVALVLTHENTPSIRFTTAGQGYPEPSPYDARMFDPKVRFVGDRVAVVAAESRRLAEEALHLIAVDYEVLPAVLSLDAALAPGAPVIHDEADAEGIWDAPHNLAAAVEAVVGDAPAAFGECAAVVETTTETQYAQHAPLETHICQSYLDGNGRLVLHTSTQVPFHLRRIIARILDLPIHRIRVVKPRIGGGFGVKQEVLVEDVCALVTMRTGRPARWEYSRPEEFVSARTRHPFRIRVKLGAQADGTLHAIEMDATQNTGAYGTHALTVLSNAGSKTLPLYNKAAHLRFTGRSVYTNLPVGGAYRGYGGTQAAFPLETALDQLAERLGLDPVELRRRNHIRLGETSPIFAALGEGREGVPMTIKSCAVAECLTAGMEAFGWAEKRSRPRDTGAYASSTTYVTGKAVERAALEVNEQIRRVGAAMLKADAAGLTLGGGRVTAPDGRSVTLAEVCTRAYYGADQFQIGATASCVPEESPPPFLASFAEVAVDVETGHVKVLDYVAAVDCGTPINPRLAEGQVEGAVANGIGYALTEEYLFAPDGRLRNADLSRYKIPGSLD